MEPSTKLPDVHKPNEYEDNNDLLKRSESKEKAKKGQSRNAVEPNPYETVQAREGGNNVGYNTLDNTGNDIINETDSNLIMTKPMVPKQDDYVKATNAKTQYGSSILHKITQIGFTHE